MISQRHGGEHLIPNPQLLIPCLCSILLAWVVCGGLLAAGADWPTYQRHSDRNAATEERLAIPLSVAWVHQARHIPQPAWPPPARQDFYHGAFDLAPRVDFDYAYQVVAAGERLFFGSAADNAVHCLAAGTGEERWAFSTEGPVRLAPSLHEGKLYFGSDDGYVYCLRAADGGVLWRYRPGPTDRRLPGNGHVISLWPVRTGLIVEAGAVYGGAGLFPEHGVYLFALDAESGKRLWQRAIDQPAQGYLATDGVALWVPSGRAGVIGVRLRDGRELGSADAYGTYLVATAGHLFCESSEHQRQLQLLRGLTYPAHFITLSGEIAYLQGPREMIALKLAPYLQRGAKLVESRQRRTMLMEKLQKLGDDHPAAHAQLTNDLDTVCQSIVTIEGQMRDGFHVWKREDSRAFSFMLAGDTLLCGRQGRVTAARAADGRELWGAEVLGKAYGLVVAGGRLFVSTDEGRIYCFQSNAAAQAGEVQPPRATRPYPEDRLTAVYARAAEAIVQELGGGKGYALVLDCGEGRLACELARRTEMVIVGVEADGVKAAQARQALARAGLAGRITVHHVDPQRLPYPKYFANLIVSDAAVVSDKLPRAPAEILRLLRPYGGLAMFGGECVAREEADRWRRAAAAEGATVMHRGGWMLVRRGPLPGAGEWTHQYANPANTSSSGDSLVRGPLEPLWFGEPGPREMIDRHNRTMAPLLKQGRLFVPANERVIVLDAYNGTRLWEAAVPGSRRVGVMRDAAHMALADDCLYILVGAECLALDVASGRQQAVLHAPQPAVGKCQWGYLAVAEDRLIGSIQEPGSSFSQHTNMCPILEGDFRPVILSDGLFALDRHGGDLLWLYRASILNSAVALGNGRAYLLATPSPPTTDQGRGRIRIDKFLSGRTSLIALDIKSGRKDWQQPVQLPFQHIVYLCYAPTVDTVFLSGTFNAAGGASRLYYGLRAFRASTGQPLWQCDILAGNPGGDHGEQWQHPVILGDKVFSKYYACDLRTGAPLPRWKQRPSFGGCGTLSASASALFFRNGNPAFFDLDLCTGGALNHVSRPGCFINIIPAGGIVSVPEASAGCTCAYPLQASFAYVPSEGLRTGETAAPPKNSVRLDR